MADTTGSNIYMKRGGGAIRLTYRPGYSDATSWIVPYDEEYQLSTSQELNQPIKKFFEDIQQFVFNEAATQSSAGAEVLRTVQNIQNMFGFQLNAKSYYASSWGGELPSELSVELKFAMGNLGKWDAKEEVMTPIMGIMSKTVPSQVLGSSTLSAPLPSGGSVFIHYGTTLLADAIKAGTSLASGIIQTAASLVGGKTDMLKSATSAFTTNIDENVRAIYGNVWNVEFGWCDGTASNFKPFYTMKSMVVQSSSCKMSPKVQMIGGSPFPIAGSITLSMKTEEAMTSLDFSGQPQA